MDQSEAHGPRRVSYAPIISAAVIGLAVALTPAREPIELAAKLLFGTVTGLVAGLARRR